MYYNPNYQNYLRQYSLGSWLGRNAGTIGTIAGAVGGAALTATGVGAAFAPAVMAAGSSMGNAIQSGYDQNQQAEGMQEQLAQQQYQNKVNIATNRLSGLQQNQNLAGLNRFGNGGGLSPSPESLFSLYLNEGNRRGINRSLTQSQQELIRRNPGNSDIEDTTIQNMMRGGTKNFYGVKDNGEIGYVTATQPFTGTEMNAYQTHLSSLMDRAKYMKDYQIPNPNKATLPDKLNIKELGGNLYPSQSTTNATGINSYPLRNLKYAMGGELTKYTGQDHSTGAQGGIKVDANGSPTATTGNQAVGLVEDGEVSYTHPETKQVYIFSKKIPYTT